VEDPTTIEDPCGCRGDATLAVERIFSSSVRPPPPSFRSAYVHIYTHPEKYTHTYVHTTVSTSGRGKSRVTSRDATTPETFGIAVVVRWFVHPLALYTLKNHHVQNLPHTTSQISKKKPFLGGQQEDGG
jgi:hypothetical protein